MTEKRTPAVMVFIDETGVTKINIHDSIRRHPPADTALILRTIARDLNRLATEFETNPDNVKPSGH